MRAATLVLALSACAAPTFPEFTSCPFELKDGMTRGLLGDRAVFVAARDGGTARPALFVFHGSGGDPSGAISKMRLISDVVDAGLVVIAPAARDARATPVWDDSTDDVTRNPDLAFFEGLRLCAVEQLSVDPRRISVTGISGGAFFSLFLAKSRSAHIASTIAFSGAMRRGVGARRERLPALLINYGGPSDVTAAADLDGHLTLAFDYTKEVREQVPLLREAGYVVAACNSGQGHGLPPDGGVELLRAFWSAHRQGEPSPFATQLSAEFPSWCSVDGVP